VGFNFFWHTSCESTCVARKFNSPNFTFSPTLSAALDARAAAFQIANIGAPPRQRPVYRPRQRLMVQGFPEAPQPVKIRHASQNLGNATVRENGGVIEIPPPQSRPA
jgi:hypothetical protein